MKLLCINVAQCEKTLSPYQVHSKISVKSEYSIKNGFVHPQTGDLQSRLPVALLICTLSGGCMLDIGYKNGSATARSTHQITQLAKLMTIQALPQVWSTGRLPQLRAHAGCDCQAGRLHFKQAIICIRCQVFCWTPESVPHGKDVHLDSKRTQANY